jgi:uncharacterized protein YkwD
VPRFVTRLLLTCPAALLTAALVGVPTTAQAGPAFEYAASAVKTTNRARVDHDRRPLRVSDCLARFARKQAGAMVEAGDIFHQALEPIMERCHLVSVGENVAYGYPTGRSVVTQGWMRSDGHRANILSRGFKIVAVAARRDADGTWYAAQVFGRR